MARVFGDVSCRIGNAGPRISRPEREKRAERLAERIEMLVMAQVLAHHGDRRTHVDLTSAVVQQRLASRHCQGKDRAGE